MAQKEKFTDDRLTDAVIRYSEAYPGKIKVTELARWASENVPGLEGVQAHNFRGKRKVVNRRTGRAEMAALEAFERIQAINRVRTGETAVRSNELLRSSDPDVFMTLPKPQQRRQIVETRGFCEKLAGENRALRRQGGVLESENISLREETERLREKLEAIQERQDLISKKISLVMDLVDREKQREILGSMGVMDGGFDLERYQQSLRLDIENAFSISRSIRMFRDGSAADSGQDNDGSGRQKAISAVFGGLDI